MSYCQEDKVQIPLPVYIKPYNKLYISILNIRSEDMC